ncbi:MAG: transposase [Burkholderia sp.]
MDTTLLDIEKPDSRKGRPNHSPEFRRRIAIAACEPGVSVAKLAREHSLNANLAFTWRHRYRAEQRASEVTLLTASRDPFAGQRVSFDRSERLVHLLADWLQCGKKRSPTLVTWMPTHAASQ